MDNNKKNDDIDNIVSMLDNMVNAGVSRLKVKTSDELVAPVADNYLIIIVDDEIRINGIPIVTSLTRGNDTPFILPQGERE